MQPITIKQASDEKSKAGLFDEELIKNIGLPFSNEIHEGYKEDFVRMNGVLVGATCVRCSPLCQFALNFAPSPSDNMEEESIAVEMVASRVELMLS